VAPKKAQFKTLNRKGWGRASFYEQPEGVIGLGSTKGVMKAISCASLNDIYMYYKLSNQWRSQDFAWVRGG